MNSGFESSWSQMWGWNAANYPKFVKKCGFDKILAFFEHNSHIFSQTPQFLTLMLRTMWKSYVKQYLEHVMVSICAFWRLIRPHLCVNKISKVSRKISHFLLSYLAHFIILKLYWYKIWYFHRSLGDMEECANMRHT